MKVRKILPLCVLLILLLSVPARAVNAQSSDLQAMTGSGECGADRSSVIWNLDADGTLMISGNGEIMDDPYSERYLPWLQYRHYITAVTVGDGVVNLPDYAFSDCDYLESVTLGNAVKVIGGAAFSGCSRLTGISRWNSVERIGVAAFRDCVSLTEIVFGHSLKKIEETAFYRCGLTDLWIPGNVDEIEPNAFAENMELKSVSIEDGITFLTQNVFHQCEKLEVLAIPASVTAIDESCFAQCWGLSDVYYSGTASQWNRIRGGGADDLKNSAKRIYFESTGAQNAAPMTYTLSDVYNEWNTVYVSIAANANGVQWASVVAVFYDEKGRFVALEEISGILLSADGVSFGFNTGADVSNSKTLKVFLLDEDYRPLCPSVGSTFKE